MSTSDNFEGDYESDGESDGESIESISEASNESSQESRESSAISEEEDGDRDLQVRRDKVRQLLALETKYFLI